ncbi:hypothetical protein QR680_014052 [Steinernema hermaphroditum]|uniref:Uncharacterized protein n=1 Tax=Steinernema hermaphroditum TaxID=289476 RepID=A0AA39M3D9_9BILA|nr:hypothetical protein QR680_014052 [Steinernema hermaphroditum]
MDGQRPWSNNQQGDNFFNNRGGGWRGGGRRGGRGHRGGGFQQRGRGGFNQGGGYNHRGRGNHQQNFHRGRLYNPVSNETGTKPTDYRSYVLPEMTQNPWEALEAQYGLPPAFEPSSSQGASSSAPPNTEGEAPAITA